jgi:bile acid-coenzyme A ligase
MTVLSVGRQMAALASAEPNCLAITCGDEALTRLEFEKRTNGLARYFASLGVKTGDTVVVSLPNGIAFLEAVFAILKIGATLLPVSSKLPKLERDAILDLARPSLVVGLQADADEPFVFLPQHFIIPEDISDEGLVEAVSRPTRGLTSGGSTGRPKIIFTTDEGVVDDDGPPGMKIEAGRSVIIPGPLYHGGPFAYAYRSLLFGGHVVVMERFDPVECLKLIERNRIDTVPLVPTMMNRIWRLDAETRLSFDLSSVRMVVHYGAGCPVWLKAKWIEWLGAERIDEFYGTSERIGFTWITGGEWVKHPGSVGRPVDCKIRVLDEDGCELPSGQVGEIYMQHKSGAGTTYRYVGADPLVQREGWETVGDMGSLDDQGYLYIADRRLDMIVSGGANVYPAEVEGALEQHPAVRACAVIGLPDDDLGNSIHAIVETSELIGEPLLREWLAERLVRYKIPRSFEFVTEPLRDEVGKLRRSRLRQERMSSFVGGSGSHSSSRAQSRPTAAKG